MIVHMSLDKERPLESCDGIKLCWPNIVITTQYSGFDSHIKFVYEG